MIRTYLDFEKPIAELENKVEELKALKSDDSSVSIEEEVGKLEEKARDALQEIYNKLTPWQKTQVARHPDRPHCIDYIKALIEDFAARRRPQIRRGRGDHRRPRPLSRRSRSWSSAMRRATTPTSRLKHNFGMARPEGYRKAVRLMELAEHFTCRSSPSSTPPAPIPASAPRSAARPRPSPARPSAA